MLPADSNSPRSHAQLQKEVPACRRRLRKSSIPIAFQAGPAGFVKPWQMDDTQPHRQWHTGTCSSSCQSAPTQSSSDQTERRRTHRECESGRRRRGVTDCTRLNCGMWKKHGPCLQNSGVQENHRDSRLQSNVTMFCSSQKTQHGAAEVSFLIPYRDEIASEAWI